MAALVQSLNRKTLSSIGFGTWAWGNKFLWGYLPEKDDDLLEKTFNEAVN